MKKSLSLVVAGEPTVSWLALFFLHCRADWGKIFSVRLEAETSFIQEFDCGERGRLRLGFMVELAVELLRAPEKKK